MRGITRSLALISLSLCYVNAYATAAGLYIGFGLGPATNDGKTTKLFTQPKPPLGTGVPANPRSNQFGGDVFVGYQWNRFAAFEGGITIFNNINFEPKSGASDPTATARVRTFNLLGKGILPFGDLFDVYLKGGVAITYLTTSGALNWNGKSTRTLSYRPQFSIGASYYLNQSWVVDVSLTRIMVGSVVNNMTYAAISLSYHFVDRYCGQFLCD